ncbi:MAG: hypothetical protein Q9Q13_09175 [Acidobacteriota bacterium]|nr:hypothetical protein [Acidobacteriota bacterium]
MKRWLIILLIAASVAPMTLAGTLFDCTRDACPPGCCGRIDANDKSTSGIDAQPQPCCCPCGLSQGRLPRSLDAEPGTLPAPSSGTELGLARESAPRASSPSLPAFCANGERDLPPASYDPPAYLRLCSFLS